MTYTKYFIRPVSSWYLSRGISFDSIEDARTYNYGQYADKHLFKIVQVEVTEELEDPDCDPITYNELVEKFKKIDFEHRVNRKVWEIIKAAGEGQYDVEEAMLLRMQVAFDLQMIDMVLQSATNK